MAPTPTPLTLGLRGHLDGLRALAGSPLVEGHHAEGVGLLRSQVAHGELESPGLRRVDRPFPATTTKTT